MNDNSEITINYMQVSDWMSGRREQNPNCQVVDTDKASWDL